MDYQGNAKRDKEEKLVPLKNVEKVVVGEVIIQKKSLGRRFRDFFIEADFRNVSRYIITDVLLPAARNTIVDVTTKGIERIMYGESAIRRRNFGPGPRITYNRPINRGFSSDVTSRFAPAVELGPRRASRYGREDVFLTSREEADLVLERMNDLIDNFDVATVADLNDLLGQPTSHIDNKWGWNYLANVQVRQTREGYLIDFPPPEPI